MRLHRTVPSEDYLKMKKHEESIHFSVSSFYVVITIPKFLLSFLLLYIKTKLLVINQFPDKVNFETNIVSEMVL